MIKMFFFIFRFDGGRNEHISLTNTRYTAESVGLCQESGTWFDEELRRATHLPGKPAGKIVNSPTRNGAFSSWNSPFMLLFHLWKIQISYQVYRLIDGLSGSWLMEWVIRWLIDWSIHRSSGPLIDWSNDKWFVDWPIDWLIDWLWKKCFFCLKKNESIANPFQVSNKIKALHPDVQKFIALYAQAAGVTILWFILLSNGVCCVFDRLYDSFLTEVLMERFTFFWNPRETGQNSLNCQDVLLFHFTPHTLPSPYHGKNSQIPPTGKNKVSCFTFVLTRKKAEFFST